MTIVITLAEALDKCNDWGAFTDEFGWDEYAVAEGGEDIEQEMSEEQALRHGIITG